MLDFTKNSELDNFVIKQRLDYMRQKKAALMALKKTSAIKAEILNTNTCINNLKNWLK
jgi:hypothetical protein